jgi:hypothetical protein
MHRLLNAALCVVVVALLSAAHHTSALNLAHRRHGARARHHNDASMAGFAAASFVETKSAPSTVSSALCCRHNSRCVVDKQPVELSTRAFAQTEQKSIQTCVVAPRLLIDTQLRVPRLIHPSTHACYSLI